MLKTLIKALITLVVMLIVIIGGLLFLVDPNQFKAAIEEAVQDNTGYQLNIAGDLELTFSPYIGVALNDVRLRNPARPQELASTTRVSLRVDPALLVRGQLLVQEFRADDFHVNWFIDADGSSIWDIAAPSSPPATGADSEESIAAEFQRISIANASIDYQDLSAGSRYSVSNLNLESSNSRLDGTAFPLEASFTYLNNGMREPTTMSLNTQVSVNPGRGVASFDQIQFSLTPMLLQGQFSATGLNDSPRFEGEFGSNTFDPIGLMESLGLRAPPEEFIGSDNSADPVQVQFSFAGNDREFVIPSLTATMGAMNLVADASVRYATEFTPLSVSYEVNASALDLTPFLADDPVADADPASPTPVAPVPNNEDTPLPLDALSGLNLVGSIAIEAITLDEFYLEDINVFTNLEDGVLDIETQPITAYDGTLQGNVRLDGRNQQGNLSAGVTIDRLDLNTVVPLVSRINSVTGRLNMESSYAATGDTVSAMMDSLTGSTSFAITENSVDITLIKQVFTAIAALSPTGDTIQQWPDQLRFQEFTGYILVEDGIDADQSVKLRMDNFDITGSGGIDFGSETFDYDLLFTVLGAPFTQTIPINQRYHDVSWPVQCAAAFSDDVNRYCRPDLTRVREIFGQLGSNEIRRRLDDVVTDQVPEQLQDAARGLLRNIFNRQ